MPFAVEISDSLLVSVVATGFPGLLALATWLVVTQFKSANLLDKIDAREQERHEHNTKDHEDFEGRLRAVERVR